ncbi:hypothetical protein GPALN_005173 [Globodera pallida]|nr:hypothetical protein GPALN_005173 [Globodera pallida]
MLTRNKCIFGHLCELGNNDVSAENGKSKKELATNAPEPQQMSREMAGGPNEYILQWFYNYEAQPPASASLIEPLAEPPAWVRFIRIHIKEERDDILEIEAFVSEDEGATVEICLCDKKNGFCYGPFEEMEQINSTTLPQCVHFNYQSILAANNAQKKDGNLLVKAKFKLNFNLSSAEGKKQQDNVIKDQQQQDDYQSCHYVLQWWHYNNNNNNTKH